MYIENEKNKYLLTYELLYTQLSLDFLVFTFCIHHIVHPQKCRFLIAPMSDKH